MQRNDAVGGEPLAQGGDDRHPAGDAGLERDHPVGLAGVFVNLRPVQGEQRFVGGHDVFAGRQGREDRVPRHVRPADQFDHHLYGRVVDRGVNLRGD